MEFNLSEDVSQGRSYPTLHHPLVHKCPYVHRICQQSSFGQKLLSVQRESLMRCCIGEQPKKLIRDLNRQTGYEYLKLIRRDNHSEIKHWSRLYKTRRTHGKKWKTLQTVTFRALLTILNTRLVFRLSISV